MGRIFEKIGRSGCAIEGPRRIEIGGGAYRSGNRVAEGAGFEPAIRFPVYTLSRRAPSTTRPPLHKSRPAQIRPRIGAHYIHKPPECKSFRKSSTLKLSAPAQSRPENSDARRFGGRGPIATRGFGRISGQMTEDRARYRAERGEETNQEPSHGFGSPARNEAEATLKSVADLVAAGLVDPAGAEALRAVEARYSVAVTPEIAALIDRADPADPIARQFLPDPRELETRPEERSDPIGDDAFSPAEGLVHRYPDRVLLKLLSVCPVYCRFCFRRETVGLGKGATLSDEALARALAYVAERPQIFEVILTGGDPLALSARRLAAAAEKLAAIPHVAVLRIHTRAPTAAPRLVTAERLAALKASGKAVYMVMHVDHARELSAPARAAVGRIQSAGISTLAQTVLLAGVNDAVDTLEELMRALVRAQIEPYYLHHPDLAPGTGHFRLSLERGRALYAELARRLSGIALPSYVLDIPGGFGKVPLQQSHLEQDEDGGWRVRDRAGGRHRYPAGD